jgi:hypothetical protein
VENQHWIPVEDYKQGTGWTRAKRSDERARWYCGQLERGQILFFRELPFDLPAEDQEFLLKQEWAALRLHKNVSYRPTEDILRGVSGDTATIARLHEILKNYATNVIKFLGNFLQPYEGRWILDLSSFRPFEEQGRDLPLHKRNDLLHVDAFPSRPTQGGRILRVFTNLNPATPRVWNVTQDFSGLAAKYANDAGLERIAESSWMDRTVQSIGAKLGLRAAGRTPYDMFMLGFHDYLKENTAFQEGSAKNRLEFPPLATWLVFTDGVAHAAISGQYALEQTFLIPPKALVAPEEAPYRILEKIAGRPLVS